MGPPAPREGMTDERTNTDRAQRALDAIEAQSYGEGFDLRGDPDPTMAHQAVKDLCGDLRHFCDRAGVDYADADSGGYAMYCEERALDPAGDWPIASFAEPAAPAPPVVVVVRHPDAANDHDAFAGEGVPVVLDVDLGSQFDGTADDRDQYDEWRAGMLATYRDSGLAEDHPAFTAYLAAVESADPGAQR